MKRYGADFYSRIGVIGGQNGTTGGFAAMSANKRAECGRIGGRISRKGVAKYGRHEDGSPLTKSQYISLQRRKNESNK